MIDVLQFLSRYDANPVGLHHELGLGYKELYSILSKLTDAKLVGFKRISKYNYFLTEKGAEIVSKMSLK